MSTKLLASKTVYPHSSWRLDEDEWQLENGRIVHKPAVRHPGSVVLVPLRQGKNGPEILMLRQFRYVLNQTILELPAGTLDWGEKPLACAQRELREETGHRAERFEALGTIWPAPGSSDEQMTLFLATGLHADPLAMDEDEQIEVVPMPFDELFSQVKKGQILDAKTIVGVWKTAVYLKHPL